MRMLHTSDFHLGFRQYGLDERMEDFSEALRRIPAIAKAANVSVVSFGGDHFNSRFPPAECVFTLYDVVNKLRASGIEVIGIEGNHDYSGGFWLSLCGIRAMGLEPITVNDVGFVGIHGVSALDFRARLAELAASGRKFDVLLMHQPVAELCGFPGVDLGVAEIVAAVKPLGCKAVLMGDIHTYAESEHDGVRFLYPGSLEITAANESVLKSVSVLEFSDTGALLGTEAIAVPTRPHVLMSVKTEAEIQDFMTWAERQGASAVADSEKPLVIVRYNPELRGFERAVRQTLAQSCLIRFMPEPVEGVGSDVFAAVANQTYERKGAIFDLKSVVSSAFEAGSREFSLVNELIASPDDVDGVVTRFAKTCGVLEMLQSGKA